MRAELADGRVLEFPDGTDPAIVQRTVKKLLAPKKPDPTEGMSSFEKVSAGAGKALTDIGRGAGQAVGEAIDAITPSSLNASKRLGLPQTSDIDEARALDAPLMATGAGKAGAIGGALVPLAALAVVPGANTIAGSAALGGALGAVEPVGTGESRGKNALVGTAVGGGSAAVLKGAGAVAQNMLAKSTQSGAEAASRNAVTDATIKAAQAEGYVLPPSKIGGGALSKATESVAGKADVGAEAALRNQQVTNRIARHEAGLAENASITEGSLEKARATIAAPYREVEALASNSPLSKPPFKSPKETLAELRQTRTDAQNEWKFYNRSGDPETLKKAQALDAKSDLLEESIEAVAKALGKPDLVTRLQEARVKLAKNFDVERALNVGSGDVDAKVIGRMLDKGRPLTGGLETIGRFAEAFPHYAREGSRVAPPGVSKLGAYGSIMAATAGGAASEHYTGTPYGAAAGLLPLLSGPARSLALSKAMRPGIEYGPGKMVRLSDLATSNKMVRGMVPLSATESVLDAQ